MKLPVSPPLLFPLRRFEHEKLKKRKIPGVAYHSLTRSHTADTSHDRLAVQSKRELLSSGDPGFFFLQCDTNSPCHLPFSKITTSRCVSCLCVVFRWTSQPRPSVTQAFAATLLADCCLQPSPAERRNVKYSLLNCQARTVWEPSQAFTVQHCPPSSPLSSNTTKSITFSSSQSRMRPAYLPPPVTHPLPEMPRLLITTLLSPFKTFSPAFILSSCS